MTRKSVNRVWSVRTTVVVALAVGIFAWLLYVPSLGNPFVWDDVILIGNPDIRTLDGATVKRLFTTNFWDVSDATSGMYRPLTTLSFYIDYQLYGNDAAGFHQTNMLLNAVTCAMVFVVLVAMFSQPLVALVAALWFSAFPMHVESVAWISGRTDIIATLFALLALWCYVRWRKSGGVLIAAASLCGYALALLGKEVAVVLPTVIWVYEATSRDDPTGVRPRRRWSLLLALCALTAGYFLTRRVLLGAAFGDLPRMTHGIVQAAALTFSLIARYTCKLVYPYPLNPTPDFEPATTLFNLHTVVGLIIAVVVLLVAARWRHRRVFVFGVAVIAFGLAPALHIVPANAVMAERFLYFPSVGYALLVALGLTYLLRRRRALAATAFSVALIGCSIVVVTGTRYWRDDLALFQRAVSLAEQNPTGHFDLGVSLALRGRYDEAIMHLRRATELDPEYADAWSALGRAEGQRGQRTLALAYCARAVAISPNDARFVNDLGTMQFQAGKYPEAAQSFRRVLELRPRHSYARFNLALCLYQQSDFDGAVRELNELPDKDRDFPNAWFFLAESESRRGNADAAAQAAAHFLTLHDANDAMAAQAKKIAAGVAP